MWAELCCSTPLSRTGGLLYPLRFSVVPVGAGGGLVEKRARALRKHGDGLQFFWRAGVYPQSAHPNFVGIVADELFGSMNLFDSQVFFKL